MSDSTLQSADVEATSDLENRVRALTGFFDLDRVIQRRISGSAIADYYNKSALGYALFHSDQGSIHMALNPSGVFNRSGYARAPQLVWENFGTSPKQVLELGSGNGFNLETLAAQHPSSDFVGIDITPRHVKAAKARVRDQPNVTVMKGDFENLAFGSEKFEGAFSIESFCHSLDARKALQSVHDALAPGSYFVVVDAWRTDATIGVTSSLLDALRLTEKSMAVSESLTQRDWLATAADVGWKVKKVIPLSDEVMPNLVRFEHMAERFMGHPILARFAGKALRLRLLENVIAGYLMAESVRSGLHTYDLVVLEA